MLSRAVAVDRRGAGLYQRWPSNAWSRRAASSSATWVTARRSLSALTASAASVRTGWSLIPIVMAP